MKELIILFLFFSSLLFGESFSLIKMRELVEEIARKNEEKIIILQNGSNIYYNDGILDKKFLEYVDGAGQESFLYILNPNKFKNKKEYYNALKNTNYDLIIIEPSFNGEFFSKSEIERLKYKKSGKKRLLIAYFSIGEAENYREYWEKKWDEKLPNWIVKENENWEGNYIVKYRSAEWKEIIKKYQDKLDEIGVDGYYLDTIDSFEFFE